MKFQKYFLFSFLLLILTISCSTTGNKSRFHAYDEFIEKNQLEEKQSVLRFIFRGWSYLDYKHLILSASHNKSYLITLDSYCDGLDFSNEILLDQAIGHQLSSRFDSIIVPKSQFSAKCRIKSIHEINKEQIDLLSKIRKEKPE